MMLVIDFDTELAMNGMVDFLGNSTGRYAVETVKALEVIGCQEDAALLQRILDTAHDAGLTYDAVQADTAQQSPFSVTSWTELHGNKWDSAVAAIHLLEEKIDFGRIGEQAERFVARNLSLFRNALRVRP